jgi:hypothetical protein
MQTTAETASANDDDARRAAQMLRLAEAMMDPGSDWQAGLGALIREIRDQDPGLIEEMAAGLRLDRARRIAQ